MPNALLLENGKDRFYKQASGLALYTLYDAFIRGIAGISADDMLDVMLKCLGHYIYYPCFKDKGIADAPSYTHTLDLSGACWCVAQIASIARRQKVAKEMLELSKNWRNVYDLKTGLLKDKLEYYEGTHWNYSFRLMHDIRKRIELCGGNEKFVETLETFFGYNDPVTDGNVFDRVIHDHRFEGLNNEPDMETPYAFIYAGRHERTAEIVRSVMRYQYASGAGGLPGNDDSGGLSSWYVWNAIGLFPVTGQNYLMVGSPIFDYIEMDLANGPFSIEVENNSQDNIYLKSLSLNNIPLAQPLFNVGHLSGNSGLNMVMTAKA